VTPSEALQQALRRAEEGLACFLCNPDKSPACARGFQSASADPAVLQYLWHCHPASLVGIATGTASNLDVLDIDAKHAQARDWWKTHRARLLTTRAQVHELAVSICFSGIDLRCVAVRGAWPKALIFVPTAVTSSIGAVQGCRCCRSIRLLNGQSGSQSQRSLSLLSRPSQLLPGRRRGSARERVIAGLRQECTDAHHSRTRWVTRDNHQQRGLQSWHFDCQRRALTI
jgi:hypothetical protein